MAATCRDRVRRLAILEMVVPTAVSAAAIDDYVTVMRQVGGLRSSLAYCRDYIDTAERNRGHAEVSLEMPVLAYGGAACLGGLTLQCMEQLASDATGSFLRS